MTKQIKKIKEYFCFYDSEFNAYDDNTDLSIPQEVISIGLCIVDKKNNLVDDYYSLIRLKGAKKVSDRCNQLTGITTRDLKNAKDFLTVTREVVSLLKQYKISTVYCYGQEDRKALLKTSRLHGGSFKVKELTRRLTDIREVFKKKTRSKIGDQGLLFIKKVCGLGDTVKHNALSDAVDLADCFDVIMHKGYNEGLYQTLIKERDDNQHYKRSRNVKEEHKIIAPPEVIKAKDIIVKFLTRYEVPNMNDGTKKAIVDDLETLLSNE